MGTKSGYTPARLAVKNVGDVQYQIVSTENISNKFREAFEAYIPGEKWTEVLGNGDIIQVDGNAAACSYLTISKNPLLANESSISTIDTWEMPFEASVGLSMSQRTVGQEFSLELISDEAPLPAPADLAIQSIFQSTTNITVNFASAHGLRPGMRIGIRDVLDSRLNIPTLVVSTTPTPFQIVITAGPQGTVTSQTSYLGNAIAATTAALAAATYANGTAGVGATLTATANGAFPAQDGISIPLNGRVLVKNQTAQLENGLYVLTQIGSGALPWILTRAVDYDTAAEMTIVAGVLLGNAIHVEQGTTQALRKYYLTATVTTVGTTAVVFADANITSTAGFVYYRPAMSLAPNGVSEIFENATATNASFYVRSEAGDVFPSGTIQGSHSQTIASTASIQAVNAALTYAFQPTNEFRLTQFVDGFQFSDVGVDSIAAATSRYKRTQVVPDITAKYDFKIKAVNHPSLTRPNAQIVSAAKTGATTATVVTDVPHGLVIGDLVVAYGVRDTTNFANLTAATAVASIVSPTSFTIVWGAAVTATSFGGFVAKVQGGNLMSALGVLTMVGSTIRRDSNIVTFVGSAAWSGVLIGDYVNLIGIRDNSTGASIGIDGAYRVRDIIATGNLLIVEPIGTTPTGADIAVVNCGGSVIKRTDMRISYVRLMDFERQRVELLERPAGDISKSAPVAVTNVPAVLQSGTWNIGTVATLPALAAGVANIGYVGLQIPLLVADVASAALTTTTTVAAITPAFGCSYEVNIPVTAVTGTTPTLDVSIEESDDSGTSWFKVYDFPRITATGVYRSPKLPLTGNRVRYVQTVGGATPSFTRAINRLQSSERISYIRQSIDRTIVLTTLGSATPSINVQNCSNAQLVINIGTATTAPTLQLQGSDDNGLTWYAIGSTLPAVASSTVQLTQTNLQSQLLRAIVTSAGATVVAGYVLIKGY